MPALARSTTPGVSLRRLSRRAAPAVVAAVLPCLLAAQTVSPPVAEYQERARSSFQLSNGTIFPLTAVLEVHGFRVTERGEVVNAPLDTSQVHVKLSATSFRIPPRGTYTVFYEAAADSTPAWFLVTAALTGARTDNGLNVRIILPHVVYLNQKQALQKGDVVVRRLELDSAAGKARVELENTGPRLGRVQELSLASSGNAARATGGFPLFPHFHRWVELDWDLAEPPARVRVRLPKFAVDTAMVPAAAAGGTSPSTDARQQAGAPAPTPKP